jgi:high affinity Mn2+ porin
VPNSPFLEKDFSQFAAMTEIEERHAIFGRPGKVKLLAYANRGRMARCADAVSQAAATGGTPQASAVRRTAASPEQV